MKPGTVEAFVFGVAVVFGGAGFAVGWVFGYKTCLGRSLRRHVDMARRLR